MVADPAWNDAADDIVAAGRRLDTRGWVPATAGNISRRLDDGRIAITRSGGHKGFLTRQDVIEVDAASGQAVQAGCRPSAETLLHCQLYAARSDVGAVVHGHSVAATVLSMAEPGRELALHGYELLKAFTECARGLHARLPILDNDQDIARLRDTIAPMLSSLTVGYLIRAHGVYVWGPSMELALTRLEALEFLLACTLERGKLGR